MVLSNNSIMAIVHLQNTNTMAFIFIHLWFIILVIWWKPSYRHFARFYAKVGKPTHGTFIRSDVAKSQHTKIADSSSSITAKRKLNQAHQVSTRKLYDAHIDEACVTVWNALLILTEVKQTSPWQQATSEQIAIS